MAFNYDYENFKAKKIKYMLIVIFLVTFRNIRSAKYTAKKHIVIIFISVLSWEFPMKSIV